MNNNAKFFSDVKKVAASAFAGLSSAKHEAGKIAEKQVKSILKSMDIVTRGEFEALKSLTLKLQNKLDLNTNMGGNTMKKVAKKAAARKPAAKKSAAKKAKRK